MSDWRAGLRTTVGGSPGWMTMRVGGHEFALPIDSVGEVLPTPSISPVPMAPAWVAGVVSVRGEVIPVLDLGERLAGVSASRDGRLVLASLPGSEERVGLLVDAVTGLVDRTAGAPASVLDLAAILELPRA